MEFEADPALTAIAAGPVSRPSPTGVDPGYAELAERCEQATGPDRELDFLIWAALNGVTEITNPAEGHPMTPGRGGRVEGRDANGDWHLYGFVDPGEVSRNWSPYGGENRYPNYTASLDAAMTLAGDPRVEAYGGPEGMLKWAMERLNRDEAPFDALPRYICAAALFALAASCDTHAKRGDAKQGSVSDG